MKNKILTPDLNITLKIKYSHDTSLNAKYKIIHPSECELHLTDNRLKKDSSCTCPFQAFLGALDFFSTIPTNKLSNLCDVELKIHEGFIYLLRYLFINEGDLVVFVYCDEAFQTVVPTLILCSWYH